ncbi:Predicted PurR-regulated permease PerM [Atopostipes suicloacalis DSM 15692]|uniref:Predicted PurR-regulated permease PerM n=1 Tax=Atopostipes suicloacalis DSM 15692 TaxID=1121025 RepID=A0A1M4U8M7_9LACT|nr:AI-2E family transporter [Atopostipes suicloacalis]SHE52913.1 Predicted PurR-regulated permease PerM [Atopostipes suicloacalis DSM 15692]
MEQQENKKQTKLIEKTWFWKYILDNKFVSILFIMLLTFLTIFAFTKILHLFTPLELIFSIVGPPVIFGILFYYLIKPMVDFIERKGLSRPLSVLLVFVAIILVVVLAIAFIIPGIQNQFNQLIEEFPKIWDSVISQIEDLLYNEGFTEIYQQFQATDIMNRVTDQMSNIFTATIGSIGNVAGIITRVLLTIATIPFVLYYLLVDGERFKKSILEVVPTRARPVMIRFIQESSKQVGSYVRGELLVAVSVAIMFYIGYLVIGLDYALILSILAGVLNLIPYLGSIMASVPALIIGAFISPVQLVKVIIVIVIEQTLEGRVISPQILGNKLEIHPLVILFILLVAGSLFGFMGLILAVPGFGILRVIWNLFFDWLKENYDFYEENPEK